MARPTGLFLAVDEDLRQKFYAEIERRNGRPMRRGDVLRAGEEAIKNWIGD
jgi:hypothetical protein